LDNEAGNFAGAMSNGWGCSYSPRATEAAAGWISFRCIHLSSPPSNVLYSLQGMVARFVSQKEENPDEDSDFSD